MRKKIKSTFLATIIMAAMCAGTVSARQLRTDATGASSCGGSCSFTNPCKTGCICVVVMETNNMFCASHPIPGARVLK